MQVPANRCRRRIQKLRDLGDRKAIHLEQLHYQSTLRRQLGERALKLVPDLTTLDGFCRRGLRVAHGFGKDIGASCRSRGREIQPAVDDDPRQPGPERPRKIEPLDVLKRRKKRVLNEIFRVLTVPQESHPERHRPRQIPLDDRSERLTLSVEDASEKLPIHVGVVIRAEHECGASIVLRSRRVGTLTSVTERYQPHTDYEQGGRSV